MAMHGPEVGRMVRELAVHHLGLALIDPVASATDLNRFASLAHLLLPDDTLAERTLVDAQALLTGEERPADADIGDAIRKLGQLEGSGPIGGNARTVLQTLYSAAVGKLDLDRYPGAHLALVQRAIAIGEPALGAYDNDVLMARYLRARAWDRLGDTEAALPELEDVVAGFKRETRNGYDIPPWWHLLELRDKLGLHLQAVSQIDEILVPLAAKVGENNDEVKRLRSNRWEQAKKAGLDAGEKPTDVFTILA